jgi:hypothetical protein
MVPVVNSVPGKVFSFVRQKENARVFAVMNFSAEPQRVTFTDGPYQGRYRDFAGGGTVTVGAATALDLAPWSYRLLTAE